jgi:hypothetical protein
LTAREETAAGSGPPEVRAPRRVGRRSFLRDHGLTLVFMALFLCFVVGHVTAGARHSSEERVRHGGAAITTLEYLSTGEFWATFFENLESEFLQMLAFIVLTSFLFQRGSPESNDPDEAEPAVAADPRRSTNPSAPWPVRRGGWILRLYEHSLALAFLALFLVSFTSHVWSGMKNYNELELRHGGAPLSFWGYLGSSTLWFESMQNWQSEFVSVAAMVYLAVFLRERGSPESKPVAAPHWEHGP